MVCLWDPDLRIGGMNHYLLPFWNGEGLPTPRFGSVAIPKLMERVENLGADRSRLVAKVFGGASFFNNPMGLLGVGERNIQVAVHHLEDLGIPVAARHVGGERGRKIIFNTETGRVLMRLLTRQAGWDRGNGDPPPKRDSSKIRVLGLG
ncbi:MAG: chemotaxis protein CheD [Nitrospirae bacterium]|nr:chemotaxis protein CheD [Nitrospirota bacterium]